jgi:hypothetical protein
MGLRGRLCACKAVPVRVGRLTIRDETIAHPLLGVAQAVEVDGEIVTWVSPIDWQTPREIPIVAAPARLPAGAGAEILNVLAECARDAGVAELRYAGPYPTPALHRALLRSFRASAGEDLFAADVLARALRVAREEVAVDFAPAPHRRVVWPRGFAEVRDGVERVVIDGVVYAPGEGSARLVDGACELWFGGERYARVATVGDGGEIVGAVADVPACDRIVVGKEFPLALRLAIAELVAELAPVVLAEDVRDAVAAGPIAWADLGARAARATADGFELHAAMWTGRLAQVALEIARELAPVAVSRVIARVSASV